MDRERWAGQKLRFANCDGPSGLKVENRRLKMTVDRGANGVGMLLTMGKRGDIIYLPVSK
jgi:hypothetical protein